MPQEDYHKKRKASHGATEIKDSEEYNDQKANIVIISSDGWRFRIQDYYLMAHSKVFRDMLQSRSQAIGSENSQPITLCDEAIETKKVITAFFEYITQQKYPPIDKGVGEDTVATPKSEMYGLLLRFADKYDCAALTKALIDNLKSDSASLHVATLFAHLSKIRHADMCRWLISKKGNLRWAAKDDSESRSRKLDTFIPRRSVMDPAAMGWQFASNILPEYFYALTRAHNCVRGTFEGTKGNWEAVGDRFYEIVTGKEYGK